MHWHKVIWRLDTNTFCKGYVTDALCHAVCMHQCDMLLCVTRQACDDSCVADLRNVCTEAGMFAIRDERDYVVQEDFMKAVRKMNDAKKLETTISYDSSFGDGGKS